MKNVALFFKNLYNIAMSKNNEVFSKINKSFYASTYICDGVTSNFHFHEVYEIYYLEKGNRNHLINGKNHHAIPGSFILIPPGVPHQTSGTAFKRRLIHFHSSTLALIYNREYISTLLKPFEKICFFAPQKNHDYILSLFNNAESAYKNNDCESFLLETAKLLRFISFQSPNIPNQNNPNLLYEIESYIHENVLDIKNLDDLAKKFFISKYYLCHLFKQNKNISVMSYISDIKIQKAANLLISTDKKINEICRLIGFNSEYYFSKCFSSSLGLSPSKYRKNFRNTSIDKSR